MMRQLEVPASCSLDDLIPVERPDPGEPGAGQVLVRMRAVSLNFRDLLVATGYDRWRPPTGRIPGSDGVGDVIKVGTGVTRFKAGDRVMTTILPNWISGPLTPEKRIGGLGGPAADGVLAELRMMDPEGLVLAPAHLGDEQAATLPTAALTAWHVITRADVLHPGTTILVGGTGGVSLFALQIGVAAGARVLITSKSAEKLARTKVLGAFAGVNYRDRADWADEVLALTDGRGVDLAIDIGGASSLNESVRATAVGGAVGIVGLVGGLMATINLAEIFQRNLRLDGIETGSREMLEAMIAWFEQKGIVPIVDRVFPFEESGAALKYLQEVRHMGKVCITFFPTNAMRGGNHTAFRTSRARRPIREESETRMPVAALTIPFTKH
jgi:NADPH:quinone reductase-like Zn-dependent oxidoreductase